MRQRPRVRASTEARTLWSARACCRCFCQRGSARRGLGDATRFSGRTGWLLVWAHQAAASCAHSTAPDSLLRETQTRGHSHEQRDAEYESATAQNRVEPARPSASGWHNRSSSDGTCRLRFMVHTRIVGKDQAQGRWGQQRSSSGLIFGTTLLLGSRRGDKKV